MFPWYRNALCLAKRFSFCCLILFLLTTNSVSAGKAIPLLAETDLSTQINSYLTAKGSPLAGTGQLFVDHGRTYNVDPRLIVAIAGAESSFAKANCQSWSAAAIFNAWGYMHWPNGVRTCRPFSSWDEGIRIVSWQIGASSLYLKAGRTTIQSIGDLYCGAGCTNWVSNVTTFFTQMGGNPNALTFPNSAPTELITMRTEIRGTGWLSPTSVNCSYDASKLIYHSTNYGADNYTATVWALNIPVAGTYAIYMYIPDYTGNMDVTPHARYWIQSPGVLSTLDQTQNKCSWVYIGSQYYNPGLQDVAYMGVGNIPTNFPVPRMIGSDAVKLIRVDSDTTAPDGNITAPANGTAYGQSQTITINADAGDNAGGTGVNRVEFHARYDGEWRLLNSDTSAPYSFSWGIPTNLSSQNITLTIHVVDHAGNRKMDPGGYRTVSYQADANERAIPLNRRFYLNQLALPDGWRKCGVASAAMVLASNGYMGGSFNELKTQAENMWNDGVVYPSTETVAKAFRKRGFSATTNNSNDFNGKWTQLKEEINAGRPVMMSTRRAMTPSGHYIVAVGYRDSADASQRYIYAYDPFGRHTNCFPASSCPNWSDRWVKSNSYSAESTVGKWVLYPWNKLTADIIVVKPAGALAPAAENLLLSPYFETELVSDEPSGPQDLQFEPIGGIDYWMMLPAVAR